MHIKDYACWYYYPPEGIGQKLFFVLLINCGLHENNKLVTHLMEQIVIYTH